MNKELIFGAGVCAVVLSGVTLAFTVTGSPGHQRSIALDEQRLDDIEQMADAIDARYDRRPLPHRLPNDIVRRDPATRVPYEYRWVSPKTFQLCASLEVASPARNSEDDNRGYSYRHWRNHHGAGHVCFSGHNNQAYPLSQ